MFLNLFMSVPGLFIVHLGRYTLEQEDSALDQLLVHPMASKQIHSKSQLQAIDQFK